MVGAVRTVWPAGNVTVALAKPQLLADASRLENFDPAGRVAASIGGASKAAAARDFIASIALDVKVERVKEKMKKSKSEN